MIKTGGIAYIKEEEEKEGYRSSGNFGKEHIEKYLMVS